MAKPNQINIPLVVSLSDSDHKTLSQIDPDVQKIVEKACNYYMSAYAQGALVIEPAHAERIQRVVKTGELSSLMVTKLIEASKGVEDGQNIFKVPIDPALMAPIQEIADSQNVTVQALITDSINVMMNNGWLYMAVPEGRSLHLTTQQLEELAKLTGKDRSEVFAADVLNLLRPKDAKQPSLEA